MSGRDDNATTENATEIKVEVTCNTCGHTVTLTGTAKAVVLAYRCDAAHDVMWPDCPQAEKRDAARTEVAS